MEWKGRAPDGIIEGNSFQWSGVEGNGMEERSGMEYNRIEWNAWKGKRKWKEGKGMARNEAKLSCIELQFSHIQRGARWRSG